MRARTVGIIAGLSVAGVLVLGLVLWATGQRNVRSSAGSTPNHDAAVPKHADVPSISPAPQPLPHAPETTASGPLNPPLPNLPGDADREISPDTAPDPDRSLEQKHLLIPVQGARPKDILDTFNQARPGGRRHEATDIMAPRDTPVLAVDEGNVVKLFTSEQGGLTVYQFDDSQTYCYYYAHLSRYARGLQEGTLLRKGDVLGYVGSTGNADAAAPHLHFTIFRLGPEKHWWEGSPINPYPLLTGAGVLSESATDQAGQRRQQNNP